MEYLIALLGILGGLVVYFFKKSQTASSDAKIAETKGRDKELEASQEEIEAAIAELDKGIAKVKAEREASARKAAEDNMSLKERADRLKKGLQ